jgi:hypothetical protein
MPTPRVPVKKTSLAIAEPLWRAVKIRAIEEGRDAQELVADALTRYLKTPRKAAPR